MKFSYSIDCFYPDILVFLHSSIHRNTHPSFIMLKEIKYLVIPKLVSDKNTGSSPVRSKLDDKVRASMHLEFRPKGGEEWER